MGVDHNLSSASPPTPVRRNRIPRRGEMEQPTPVRRNQIPRRQQPVPRRPSATQIMNDILLGYGNEMETALQELSSAEAEMRAAHIQPSNGLLVQLGIVSAAVTALQSRLEPLISQESNSTSSDTSVDGTSPGGFAHFP